MKKRKNISKKVRVNRSYGIKGITELIETIINNDLQKSLVKRRLKTIESLLLQRINRKKGCYLYFALLCNSIIEVIARNVSKKEFFISENKVENISIKDLLLNLKTYRYISEKTYNNCTCLNDFRGTVHLNSSKDFDKNFKASFSLNTMLIFIKEICKNIKKIKTTPQTIISVIGGCDISNKSDMDLLFNYSITADYLKSHYSNHIVNNELYLTPDYSNSKYKDEIKKIFKQIISEKNDCSRSLKTGIINAIKGLGVKDEIVYSYLIDHTFQYDNIESIINIFYTNFQNVFLKYIRKIVNDNKELLKSNRNMAFDFMRFLIAISSNLNINNITEIMLKIYEITGNIQMLNMITDLFCPDNPQTLADDGKRIFAIKLALKKPSKEFKIKAYELLMNLLPHNRNTQTCYRDINGKAFNQAVTYKSLSSQYKIYQDLALKYASKSEILLTILSENLKSLRLEYINGFANLYINNSSQYNIASELYCRVFTYTYNLPSENHIRDKFEEILNNKNQKYRFNKSDLFNYLFNNDHAKYNNMAKKKFIDDLNQDSIIADLMSYASQANNPYELGDYLYDIKPEISDADIDEIIKCVLSQNTKVSEFISSYIKWCSDDSIIKLFNYMSNRSDKEKLNLLYITRYNNCTVSLLKILNKNTQDYFWVNRKSFLCCKNDLSESNFRYTLKSLLKFSRPYSFLEILSISEISIDEEMFLKVINTLTSSKDPILTLNQEYTLIAFAIDYINKYSKSDKLEAASKILMERSNKIFFDLCKTIENNM